MSVPTTDTNIAGAGPWRGLALRSGAFVLLACAVIALTMRLRGDDALPLTYFFEQDAALLIVGGLALLALGAWRWRGAAVRGLTLPQVVVASIATGALAYAGAYMIFDLYGLSRDEVLAEFAATHLRQGLLGQPIGPELRDLAKGMMPLWSHIRGSGDVWSSGYLPVNSALRALFDLLGDRWLTGPVLLAVGGVALWSAARRIWPDRPQAATVTLVLALTSTQVLANAMTAYAMTGYFALHALWLACFLRGGRVGHGAAILIGLAAAGLHQWHFHLMFVSGFVLWLWLVRQRGLALLYAAACAGYVLVWGVGYPALLDAAMGLRLGEPLAPVVVQVSLVRFGRLAQLEPVTSLARFAAWQNVLLIPLAAIGVAALRGTGKPPTILLALAISCAAGLATMVFQGYGYGYRYLNGMIPGFCLLAAAGWLELERRGARMPGALLWASAAVALLVTAPFALWRSQAFMAPYKAAYRAVRAAPADVVLVDTRAGRFVQDIVRIDGAITPPLLLDLGYVPAATLARFCATKRVMLFDERQARALGIREPLYAMDADGAAAKRRAELTRLKCAPPVPLG